MSGGLKAWYNQTHIGENIPEVIRMEKGLDKLLSESSSAKIFYSSLPDYVQGAIMKNTDKITDEETLRREADRIMHEFT